MPKHPAIRALLLLALLFIAIQAVPYGRAHTNPPVTAEPAWSSPEARALAVRACFDCHSNQTHWPWYASVAPMSWLAQRDVDEARKKLNFSTWDKPQRKVHDAAEELRDGEMPPWFYLPAHADANLSAAEKTALAQALATLAATVPGGEHSGDHDD